MRQAGGGCGTLGRPGGRAHSPSARSLSYSSSQDELEGKPKVPQQEEGPKGVDEQSESSEESEEEKPPEEDKEEEEEKKAPTPQEKKRRKGGLGIRGSRRPYSLPDPPYVIELRVGPGLSGPDAPPPPRADSSDESDSSEESDIDSEASSALFMAVRPSLGWAADGVSLSRLTSPALISAEKEDAPQEGAETVRRQLAGQQPAWHAQHRERQHLLDAAGRRHQAGAG